MPNHAVVDRLGARFGEHGVAARLLSGTIPGKDGFILDVGGTPIAVAFEPFAMPFDELRPPIRRGATPSAC